jgi:4-amino-4-deoxy-L-arabinose transferase-like glycosyltransferase
MEPMPAQLAVHERDEWYPTSRDRAIAFAAVVVFVATRLMHLGSYRLWFDEIFTLEVSWRDWRSLIWFVQNYDVHPPLFYVLSKLWIGLGGLSYFWLGLFPALTAIATLYPTYLLARELRLRPAEFNLMIVLMAVNGYLTGYAQEFRAYDWLMLLATFSLWLFVRFFNAPPEKFSKSLWPLAIVNLILAYTHYFGWLLIATEGLFLLFWTRRSTWQKTMAFSIAVAGAVVAYLPWAYLVIQAAGQRVEAGQRAVFYIPRPNLFSLVFFYGALDGLLDLPHTTLAGVLLFAAPVMLWGWRSMRGTLGRASADWPTLMLLAMLATIPVAAAFVISLVLPTAIWGQRHLIIIAAPYFLMVAAAVFRLPSRWLRSTALVALVSWALVAGVWAQFVPYKTPAWDTLAQYIVSQTPVGQRTRIYALDEDAAVPMQFYLWRTGRTDLEVAIIQEDTDLNRQRFVSGTVKKPYWALTVPVILVKDLSTLAGPFWICDDQEDAANIGFPGKSLTQIFRESGYAIGPSSSATVVNRRWNSRKVGVFPVSSDIARR